MKVDIKSLDLKELTTQIVDLGLPKFRAKQIYDWLHKQCVVSFDEMTNLSKDLRTSLDEQFEIRNCKVVRKLESQLDGTKKYLFELNDGETVESVLMKYKYGYTVCVSSQVGCNMKCSFCASTIDGCVRSLEPSEILSQIYAITRDNRKDDKDFRVSHIVLMGMGEPLDNYENVLKFLELISNEDGLNISARNISLSTCGIVPKIYDLIEKHPQFTLSVSLHAPNDEIRSRIMPVNKKWGVDELLEACKEYTKATNRRISFEYAMMDGINDTDECAKELRAKLKGTLCHVNLIPANEVRENDYKRSTLPRLQAFSKILEAGGITTTIRRSLGGDIDASCGQLRRNTQKGGEA
ncbi:MAG: 23S rRNA (adenine(2503)-C(2))-methyltransferase RlmN [Oscillospiraceae bacterium]|nr:23S rRNA (adenine(2503)-C(2))-methyltransferase RlmN [Candidatus Limimonas coprohippi]MCQ2487737.1 23S rRNA (adenine(2503)-C(2))-methyltransferase RlmN [Clostridia bacterium]